MQTYLNMQTTLRTRKGGRAVLAAAYSVLLLGLASQAYSADRALFFIKDAAQTKSNSVPIVSPVVTNTFETKVVVVNREDQTFTIEHQGKLHLFRVQKGTALYNAKGKPTTLDWVQAGQTMSIKVIERQSGSLDLLAANIVPSHTQLQAAGKKSSKKAAEVTPTTPATEPVVFPSEDARPHVPDETPDTSKPETGTDNPQPQPENPQPTEEPK